MPPVLYEDPDRPGQYLTPDQVDWSQYQDAGAPVAAAPQQDAGWGGVGMSALEHIPGAVVSPFVGLERLIAENVPGAGSVGITPEKAKYWEDLIKQADQNVNTEYPIRPNTFKDDVRSTITGAGSMIPAIVSGDVPMAVADFATRGLGSHYEQLRSEGVEPGRAAEFAAPLGALEGAVAALPLSRMLPGSSLLNKLITTPLALEAQAGITGAADTVGDRLAVGHPTTTPEQLRENFLNGLRKNLLSGLFLGGIGGVRDRISGGQQSLPDWDPTRDWNPPDYPDTGPGAQQAQPLALEQPPTQSPSSNPPGLPRPAYQPDITGRELDLSQRPVDLAQGQELDLPQSDAEATVADLARIAQKTQQPPIVPGGYSSARSDDVIRNARRVLDEVRAGIPAEGPGIVQPGQAVENPAAQVVKPQEGFRARERVTFPETGDESVDAPPQAAFEDGLADATATPAGTLGNSDSSLSLTSQGMPTDSSVESASTAPTLTGRSLSALSPNSLSDPGSSMTQNLPPVSSSYSPSVNRDDILSTPSFQDHYSSTVAQPAEKNLLPDAKYPVYGDSNRPQTEDMQLAPKPTDEGVSFNIKPSKLPLDAEGKAVEKRFTDQINADPQGTVSRYIADNTSPDGTVTIDTDRARELSADYGASNQTRARFAQAVHGPASAIASEAYKQALAGDKVHNLVTITGGGGGAGKSSSLAATGIPADVVLDTTLGSMDSARERINQALDSDRNVLVQFTWSGPRVGAERAMARAAQTGRSVPPEVLGEDHFNAPRNFLQLAKEFGNSNRVDFLAFDNSGAEPVPISLENLKDREYSGGKGGNKDAYIEQARTAQQRKLQELQSTGAIDAQTADGLRTQSLQAADRESFGSDAREPQAGSGSGERQEVADSDFSSEKGAITLPFRNLDLGKKIKDFMLRFKDAPEGLESIMSEIDRTGGDKSLLKQVSAEDSVKYFEGRVFNRDIPIASTAVKAFRTAITRPSARAKAFPISKPVMDAKRAEWRDAAATLFDLHDTGKPYWDLLDKTRVNQLLIEARRRARDLATQGKKLNVTPQSLQAAGLTQPEVDAYFGVRKMMDLGWDHLHQRAIETKPNDPKWKQEVDTYFNSNKGQHYVPFHRFGDLFVYGEKPGEEPWYSLHDSLSERNKTAANLTARGFTTKAGKLRPESDEALSNLPRGIALDLHQLFQTKAMKPGDMPPPGFKGHFLEAKLIPGVEQNLQRNVAEYVQGLSSFGARIKYGPEARQALEAIDFKKQPQLYDYWSRWLKYVDGNTNEMQALKSMFAHYYLGFLNPKSALINASQPITSTYPELGKLTKQPMVELGKAYRLDAQSLKDPAAFARQYPELAGAMHEATRTGALDNGVTGAIVKQRRGVPNQTTWSDVSMSLFSTVEAKNRRVSFIAGYQNAPAGMTPEQKTRFAEEFVRTTQFDYSKLNRPELARGIKAPFFTFRNFGLNYLGQLIDNIGEKNWLAVTRMVAPMIALGGLASMPLAKETIGALIAAGYDPKKKVREVLPQNYMADLMLYGIPFLLGVNISGSIGPGELAPDLEEGGLPSVLRFTGGVPVGTAQRVAKAAWTWNQTGEPMRSLEPLLPEGLRAPAVAARAYREGGFRDPRGIMSYPNPSPFELGAKALGFNPSGLAKAYEERASLEQTRQRIEEYTSGLNAKLARAIYFNESDRAQSLVAEALAHGVTPNMAAVQEQLKQIGSGDYHDYKRMPKLGRGEMADTKQVYRK